MQYRNWTDYFWPGTDVLRNKLNVRDGTLLNFLEAHVSHIRIFERVNSGWSGGLDYAQLCDVHRTIFQDIYDWAGQPRMVPNGPMTKTAPDVVNHPVGDRSAPLLVYRYYPGPRVQEAAQTVYRRLADEQWLMDMPKRVFVSRISKYWGALDAIHSFREGNTRAQLVFFHELAQNAGYSVGLPSLFDDRRQDFVAARFHGHATGNYQRLADLLMMTVEPRDSLALTERERAWTVSLMQRVRETEKLLQRPPPSIDDGIEL